MPGGGFRRLCGRDDITLDAQQFVILEHHHDAPLLENLATPLVYVNIVPAVAAKRVDHEGCAERKLHLVAGHAGAQLGNHLLRDVIPLLDIDLVRPEIRQQRDFLASGQQRNDQYGNTEHEHPGFCATSNRRHLKHPQRRQGDTFLI